MESISNRCVARSAPYISTPFSMLSSSMLIASTPSESLLSRWIPSSTTPLAPPPPLQQSTFPSLSSRSTVTLAIMRPRLLQTHWFVLVQLLMISYCLLSVATAQLDVNYLERSLEQNIVPKSVSDAKKDISTNQLENGESRKYSMLNNVPSQAASSSSSALIAKKRNVEENEMIFTKPPSISSSSSSSSSGSKLSSTRFLLDNIDDDQHNNNNNNPLILITNDDDGEEDGSIANNGIDYVNINDDGLSPFNMERLERIARASSGPKIRNSRSPFNEIRFMSPYQLQNFLARRFQNSDYLDKRMGSEFLGRKRSSSWVPYNIRRLVYSRIPASIWQKKLGSEFLGRR